MEAAHFWRLTPGEFDAKEPNEKAEMVAFHWVSKSVEAYHYDMSERAAANEASKR